MVQTEKSKLNTFSAESLPERITDVFIMIMTTVFLCSFGSKGYLNIVETKYTLFCIFTGAYAVLSLITYSYLLLSRRISSASISLKKAGPARIFILLYALFTFVSFMLSDNRTGSLVGMSRYEGLITLLLYCSTALLISISVRPKMLYLYSFGVGISFCCGIAILQFAGLNPFYLYPSGMNYYDKGTKYLGEYLGTAGNADLLSGIIAIAIPLFFCFAFITTYKKNRLLLIPAVLSLITFAGMKVSGCMVGTIAGMALFLPLISTEKHRKKILLTEAIVFMLLLAGTCIIYSKGFCAFGLSIPPRFENMDSGRLYIWKNVLELIKERPLFGFGPDTLIANMSARFERIDAAGTTLTAAIDVAHNEYLNVWVNQGLFAVLSFTAFIAGVLIPKRNCPQSKALIVLKCAFLCYALQAFFEISMIINAPFFWILGGIIIRTSDEA